MAKFTEQDILAKLKEHRFLIERITEIEQKLRFEDYDDDEHKQRLENKLRLTKLETARLQRYIALIDPKCAGVLQAVYVFGKTYADYSDKLGITEDTAYKRRRKGIRDLTAVFNRAESL